MKVLLKTRKYALIVFINFILIETVSLAAYSINPVSKAGDFMQEAVRVEAVLSPEEQRVLDLVNGYRKEYGLHELKTFARLHTTAMKKAIDLVEYNYMAHDSDTLGTPFEMLRENGIEYEVAGENIAGNQTADNAVQSWINSKLHRENLLDERYEYTAIAVVESPIYGKVYVQLLIAL